MPVKIEPDRTASFVLGFADGVSIHSYDPPPYVDLRPGDVCRLAAEVTDVADEREPVGISIDILAVEFVEKMDRSRVSEAEMDQMLEQLGAARERQQEKAEETTCENCGKIDGSTRLTVETQIEGRDLHFCAQCDRLLSTDEYHRWQDIN